MNSTDIELVASFYVWLGGVVATGVIAVVAILMLLLCGREDVAK